MPNKEKIIFENGREDFLASRRKTFLNCECGGMFHHKKGCHILEADEFGKKLAQDHIEQMKPVFKEIGNSIKQAHDKAIEKAVAEATAPLLAEIERLRSAGEWNYISEKGVPGDSGKYLVTNEYGYMCELYYNLCEGEWRAYDVVKYDVKVIAWREVVQAAEVK